MSESQSKEPQAFEGSKLHSACFLYPAIDNHAHPLLAEEHRDKFALEGLISEAQGPALTEDSVHTLACLRAVRQLSKIVDLGSEKTWESYKAARSKLPYRDLCQRFMDKKATKTQCIFLDDGLGNVDEFAEGCEWHDQFTSSPTKRIVRVEIVAEGILTSMLQSAQAVNHDLLNTFSRSFEESLTSSANDSLVVGYKSIACYRTGLDITVSEDVQGAVACLAEVNHSFTESGKIRLAHKALNDHIVRIALKVSGECGKPIQFHTGLGDNDLSLNHASPAHLQPVIKAFPKTPFVLLHSAYPFTREAGYLTAVYSNVWLDFGEVFPFVSAAGQRSIIQQVLELAPTNKILWSTDGHWWPESFYLGCLQAREVLWQVLSDYLRRGELSEDEAVLIVQNALFHNANKLYKLALEPNLTE
ncbi:CBM1 domain-containing protein [Mycena indigotica]|uniref:CBM1 domain-containing protein n=1 Tax=Mycena indigotica TaxID=2126181 RepID=A0A8H6T2A5_9AGAR|nr:CBM1 domain-containing protein [Mycena indigotica]KAF7309726.1 CBM1 domain-containing protein [Mycena indigotica]